MLHIDNLTVSYGQVVALAGVSFEAPRGCVTAVIGANGAGKSTLMRTIAGLIAPKSGEVTFDGSDLAGVSTEERARQGLVLVPEGRSTIAEFTIEENLRLGGLWRSRIQQRESIAGVFDLFPALAKRHKMHANILSGGERQQLAIGRALMAEPTCLLLDEPSLGLAPLIVQQILELAQQLAIDKNLAILLVEQNAVTALRVARTGIVLNLGEVVLHGPAQQIASNKDLRHAYLGY